MTTYQCESCGGELELSSDKLSGVCRYCRSKFFFREEKSEALVMALNRAGEMRRKCDFDGALTEYAVILNRTPKDAEAHWGMVLSTYGIEYVEDPRTQSMMPTCRRTVMKSILEDEHYLEALSCASEEQKPLYEKKASVIDRLQKKIKRQLEDEEDYDVFISFKSTDENGYPTKDREIARNIYEALRARNIRAFYSEVTLADRIGEDYEPIIYKALYSSKCFILVATQEAYVNAVWVKNEWSRFRDRITDEGLRDAAFAVFDGMSPMALPPFLRAQGIDLAKFPAGGYEALIADNLARKWGLAPKEESAEAKRLREELEEQQRRVEEQLNRQKELEQRLNSITTTAQQGAGGVSVSNLLSRAKLFLEEENWSEASKQAERVLDMDSHCAEAYLVKLLCELHLANKEQLRQYTKSFDDSIQYKRAVQFADEELRSFLTECAENARQAAETARKEEIYLKAVHAFDSSTSYKDYQKAAEIFAQIVGYKDADERQNLALVKAENARREEIYLNAVSSFEAAEDEESYRAVADIFARIPGYKDADAKKAEAENAAKELVYRTAQQIYDCAQNEGKYRDAAEQFARIPGYKDADERQNLALTKAKKAKEAKIASDEAAYQVAVLIYQNATTSTECAVAADSFKRIYGYKDAIELEIKARNQAKEFAKREERKEQKKQKRKMIVFNAFPFLVTVISVLMSIARGGAHWIPIVINIAALFGWFLYRISKKDNDNRFLNLFKKTMVVFSVLTVVASIFVTFYYAMDNGINCYKYSTTSVGNEDGICIDSVRVYLRGDVKIPEQIDGYKVIAIGDSAFEHRKHITSVTIPDGVTSIGDSAFYGCTGLTSATIGNGVTSIGDSAFKLCKGLTNITVDTENTIYHSSGNCLIKTESKTLIFGCNNSVIPSDGSVKEIAYEAFYDCAGLISIIIPDSVTSIGEYAFFGCTGLSSVTMGSGMKRIGDHAFSWCESLTSVTFANTSGWYRTDAWTSGISISVTDESVNATNLRRTYTEYDWVRKG